MRIVRILGGIHGSRDISIRQGLYRDDLWFMVKSLPCTEEGSL